MKAFNIQGKTASSPSHDSTRSAPRAAGSGEERSAPPTASATDLAEMILGVHQYFLVDLAKELSQSSVSFVQFFLLGHLEEDQALTMSEIAKRMGHSTAAATGLVDRLEKLGYVQRSHSKEDRRKVLVQISRKGSRLVEQVRSSIMTRVEHLMDTLTDSEKSTWVEIYQKIFNFFQEA